MRKTSRLTFGIALTAALALGPGGTVLADHIGSHQHVLTTPGGTQDIALGLCNIGPGEALDNFHARVHTGQAAVAFSKNPVTITSTGC